MSNGSNLSSHLVSYLLTSIISLLFGSVMSMSGTFLLFSGRLATVDTRVSVLEAQQRQVVDDIHDIKTDLRRALSARPKEHLEIVP